MINLANVPLTKVWTRKEMNALWKYMIGVGAEKNRRTPEFFALSGKQWRSMDIPNTLGGQLWSHALFFEYEDLPLFINDVQDTHNLGPENKYLAYYVYQWRMENNK